MDCFKLYRWIFICLLAVPLSVNGQVGQNHIYVAKYKGDRTCAVSYTFDDGLADQYTVLFPQLKKFGIKASFWIWGKGIEHPEFQLGKPRMTWAQMREMAEDGQEISSHTWSHPNNMPELSDEQIEAELTRNDTAIYHHIGIYPRTLAYPGNNMSERVIRLASKGRVATRTSQFAVGEDVSHITSERLRDWLHGLLKHRQWGVTMTHGIIRGYDYFHEPSLLWKHFKEVSAMRDSVWIATFHDVAAYVKEQQNVRLQITKRKSGYRVKPVLHLDEELFSEPLTMVVRTDKTAVVKVFQRGKRLPLMTREGKILFDFNPYKGIIIIKGL